MNTECIKNEVLTSTVQDMYSQLAEIYGMKLIMYDDGYYYDFHFKLNNGIEIIKPSYNNYGCWVLQFKADLSYAQLIKTNLDFKELTVTECLSKVFKLKDLAESFKDFIEC